MIIQSKFTDEDNLPLNSLTPTIKIYNIITDTLEVNWDSMVYSDNDGWYEYQFSTFNPEQLYQVDVDGGASIEDPFERYQYQIIPAETFPTPVIKFGV